MSQMTITKCLLEVRCAGPSIAKFTTSRPQWRQAQESLFNRKTGRGCGNAVLPRQEWRYAKATGRFFQKKMGTTFGFDMGLEDRLLLQSLSQRQRRLDDRKMKQLAEIIEGRISEVMSTDEVLAKLAIVITKVKVDRSFTHVAVSWLCRGDGDDEIQKILDEGRHTMRRKVSEVMGCTCPEMKFIGDRTALMEQEMEKLFREADYGVDYRTLSKSASVLGNVVEAEMTAENSKLRILCLHGYRQCAESFRQKTGSTRKVLKSLVDCEFANAPHKVKADGDTETSRGWWFSNEGQMSFSSREVADVDVGFDDSVKYVVDYIKENGPFDGLLGFSQGASMVHLLLAKQQLGEISLPGIKFAIFFSGFLSLSSKHDSLTCLKIDTIPTLHISGLSDEIVARDKSQLLATHFLNTPIEVSHDGGHLVPAPSKYKQVLIDFLTSQKV